MPLNDFLPAINRKLETDKRNQNLLSLQHALEAYSAAIQTPDVKEGQPPKPNQHKAPTVRSALVALSSVCSKIDESVLSSSDLKGLPAAVGDEMRVWDNNRFKYTPNNVKAIERLNGGKASTTYKAEAAAVQGTSTKVFKPEPAGFNYNLNVEKEAGKGAAVPGAMKVDEIGSRLSARAVASYKVDKLLQCKVLARTRFACTTIQEGGDTALFGTLQDWTGGTSLNRKLLDNAEGVKSSLYKDPNIIKQLQHLQLVDWVTGQTDRHPDNIHITDQGVLGIDHDFSFGTGLLGKDPSFNGNAHLLSSRNKGLPKFVDTDLKKRILETEPDTLLQKIRPYLSTEECSLTQQRFEKLQEQLRAGSISEVSNWQEQVTGNETAMASLSKNSYLYSEGRRN